MDHYYEVALSMQHLGKDQTGVPGGLAYSRLCVAVMLALGGQAALAQSAVPSSTDAISEHESASDPVNELGTITVIGVAAEEEKKIGNTTGASKEDVERRGASHMSDLIDQISGTSVNSLYARPEVSVGVQGIAGHGRVSQSLEGITQNFHAFTRDIGQTGSIFVEPQFLKSIDVTRGVYTSTGTLGSLGGSVDFRYLDVDDILLPDRSFGGMVRGSTGFSKYKNGQKPSGSFFLGGRNERWDVMLGASDSENEAYRIGSHFDEGDMLKYFHASNLQFYQPGSGIDPSNNLGGDCRYNYVLGIDGGSGGRSGLRNCQLSPERLKQLQQAAKSGALGGTEKKADSQMLRVRHYFNDDYDQSLELFATASHAKFQTDQEPSVWLPLDGSDAYWNGRPWHIGSELDNRVISLKYQGYFSGLINPQVQVYRESQDRKQRWKGIPGTEAVGQDLHYFIDNNSTGIKLSNASHFSAPKVGPLRLDAALELRRTDKDVNNFSEDEWLRIEREKQGLGWNAQDWDPSSRNTTYGIALNLSTESDGPWQTSVGVGWQRVKMDVFSPRFRVGNVAKAGILPSGASLIQRYRSQGYSVREARQMAQVELAELSKYFKIDPNSDNGYNRTITDDQEHSFNLKSASFGLQYTKPGTGLTAYGSIGYSERAPTSNEMYTSGAWLKQSFLANPHLQPEKNLSLQLGVNYQHSAWLTPSDELSIGVGYYRNRIRNYIGYGPIWIENDGIQNGSGSMGSAMANVNNLETVIRHGFELNLAYRQPLFYVRGNLTVPLRHDNKMCSYRSPSGNSYYVTTDTDGNTVYSPTGHGGSQCYSGWNWMETSLIDPIRASMTAALTPYGGKLEVGGTLHFRGKQRAAYYYVESAQTGAGSYDPRNNSSGPLPNGDGWVEAYLWPKTIKVDLFANYRFNDQLKVGVYLANLTDEFDGVPTSFGYNFYPGRTITANLEYRF
ncbi:TonB-dependent receptor domain-containing protein [Achromobacter xylosoxidans]|uniref:TonB-dependent receptor domain-containing protein n=1 Tax=Alcaligenes xylosoxydans xylosoxydans TaxID=85698 RepID=UPI0012D77C81|nr:TonB-dependent receptor [Achromobacter xylosoxidans]QKQ55926.1 TonB-dependent receptor [Achromobacter xylosoxidans]QPR94918.1 TonB-dependent receptor [Achromobacter xylosoxidans]UON38859.1 TonB-dependent receptor [Achromobacter xylosoxidans]